MSWPGNSVYAVPRPKRKKRRKEPRLVRRLRTEIRELKHKIKELEHDIKDTPVCRGYRKHIAALHFEVQRLRDPSIPKKAQKAIRKAVSRIDEIPNLRLHAAEKVFVQDAVDRGYEVYRNGWPDFLLIHKESGRYRFVEVKSPSDGLSVSQVAMFEALEQCGLEIEVYRAGKDAGKRISSWRKLQSSDASPKRAAMSCRGGETT